MTSMPPSDAILKDSIPQGWVERCPGRTRPFLRLARYDRPAGFWLLGLPAPIGLTFAGLNIGFGIMDIMWTLLFAIGAIAMRGAGCTYNDIVDRDLDVQVERTALRPLASGSVSLKQAWIWLLAQCGVGLLVLLCLPRLAQIIALCSLILVAIYPFMKRITFWPQSWLGLTFNWAVLVAYATKTGELTLPIIALYVGLVFWTIGYDTIYACQDVEDDAMIGVKSTARLFGDQVPLAVGILYTICTALIAYALFLQAGSKAIIALIPFALHLAWQTTSLPKQQFLPLFKSNRMAALLLIFGIGLYWLYGASA